MSDVTTATIILSAFSLLGSISVITTYICFPSIRTFNHRFILCTCLANCIAEISKLVLDANPDDENICIISNFLVSIGETGQQLWLNSILFSVHMILRGVPDFLQFIFCCHEITFRAGETSFDPSNHEKKYHVVIWTTSVVLSVLSNIVPVVATPGATCVGRGLLLNLAYAKLGTVYLLWIVCVAYNFYVDWVIKKYIQALDSMQTTAPVWQPQQSGVLAENIEVKRTQTMQNLQRMRYYPSLICGCLLFGFLDRLYFVVTGGDANPVLTFLRNSLFFVLSLGVAMTFFSTPKVYEAIKEKLDPWICDPLTKACAEAANLCCCCNHPAQRHEQFNQTNSKKKLLLNAGSSVDKSMTILDATLGKTLLDGEISRRDSNYRTSSPIPPIRE
eukprot:TRINITY_DN17773_c0_g1_i1.p1 TRINITY_DN17773_c0_g1~~TRINITY_DN17773_c0_g1_i1.p1  ORF type:complete len:389 (+),score=70.81 TRINITY_DN17773_c0_g1_i1:175-1341(+)